MIVLFIPEKNHLIHHLLSSKEMSLSKGNKPIEEHIRAVGQYQFNICIIRILEEKDNGHKK